ncbi:MAG TPA: hypothetical protein VMW27_16350 [Thermoanaerobaculia bacterium]|nr:hypothetical protein [Thermoanaerobaculia bacterium]
MTWVGETGFARRPIVVVEDHLHHVSELLEALASTDETVLARMTVVCLDRPGPDTDRVVGRWLRTWPRLQVAAAGEGSDGRQAPLDPSLFDNAHRFCRTLAGMLRPGGMLLQDIQLSTLRFIPADRWWESIFLASTVRGMFPEGPPVCRFLSNKRGYEATFGRDLLDAGFDPRDVIDKNDLATVVVPVVRSFLDRAFPLLLEVVQGSAPLPDAAVARGEIDVREVESALDLVLWCGETGVEVGGRLLADGRRLALKAGSQEALTWTALVEDRLAGGAGVPVLEVGRRLAPEGAERAELTNLAARHIHGLRGRLQDGAAIVTAHHAYRLSERLKVGKTSPRLR